MVRVGADLRWPAGSGIGVVASEIASRLSSKIEIVDLKVSGGIGSPLSPLMLSSSMMGGNGIDVHWNPGFIPPLWAKCPKAITVHDLTHLHYYTKAHKAYYDYVLKPLYRRCERIVCVSEFTKAEFCNWSDVSEDRVSVVYNGVSEVFSWKLDSETEGQPYILYPGNYRGYKNLSRLIKAYSLSKLPGEGISLAMTGCGSPELLEQAAKYGVSDKLKFLGFLSEEQLAKKYRNALGVAFISLYEGFGLPVVEGMASGVPVLVANASCLPEIAGGAALVVDPTDLDSISEGLNLMVFDHERRRCLIDLGRERVKKFSWNASANAVSEILISLSGRGNC